MEENKSSFGAGSEQWNAQVEEMASSGLSVAEFCRGRGIPVWQMRYRLRRRKDGQAAGRGFVEIGRARRPLSEGLWVEAGRFRIRVERGFDAAHLRRVAEALA